jgi:uroporphyrinogen decarboxylase
MNSRKRVILALSHEEPDRVPIDLAGSLTNAGISKEAHRKLKKCLGLEGGKEEVIDPIQQLVMPDQRILDRFDVDIRAVCSKPPRSWTLHIEEDEESYYFVDEWKIKFRMPKQHGYYFDPVEFPLAKVTCAEELDDYNWPDSFDPGRIEGLEEEVKNLYENTNYALLFGPTTGIFETVFFLRGMENFFIDWTANIELAEAILDKMLEFHLGYWEQMLPIVGKYVQVVKMSDDLGSQNGPLINPATYRKAVKPRQKELFSFIKERTDAKLYLHSCGSIYELIPDLIECGVEVLNPVQVSAKDMDTARLKKEFGDKMCFWGAVDVQRVLPYGSPMDVRGEVKKRIKDLAPGGGYVVAPSHNIQRDVPAENIIALYEAAKDYGRYPIRL